MKYMIKCNGKIIAQFVDAGDRDVCIDVLKEMYDDCVFEAIDD